MVDKEHDLVVFGATGYTGKLIVERLLEQYGLNTGLHWAIAGRSQAGLDSVKRVQGLPADFPTILASSDDSASLSKMAAKTRLCLSVVGPYQKFGSELVSACVRQGTSYVDLCGEPVWMREMIDRHEADAQRTGARILFSCGFDSIPFELGVYGLQREAIASTGEPIREVSARVRMHGKFSAGTLASVRASQLDVDGSGTRGLVNDPFALTPGFKGPVQPDPENILYDETMHTWTSPYIMAPINSRNVHRSNYLQSFLYGKDFTYDERMITGPADSGKAAASALSLSMNKLLVDEPDSHDDPTPEERAAGAYTVYVHGQTFDGTLRVATVSSDRDPGYGSTSQMIVETAMCLLDDTCAVPGGIWTPVAALQDSLRHRLVTYADINFDVRKSLSLS